MTDPGKLPPLAFYPELPGEVVLGHQVSPETGDLTLAPLRLSRDAHFHTAFCGDTGYGKSVAAVRMAYETTRHWKLKTIVLDFGTGWRQLLNAPGLAGHVEIRQLSPGGVRPLRWNPLQVGRNVLPEVQWRAFSDLFGTIAQLGQKRQAAAGSITSTRGGRVVDDPGVATTRLGHCAARRVPLAGAGRHHSPTGPARRLALAVERSQVGLGDLYRRIGRDRQRACAIRHRSGGIAFRWSRCAGPRCNAAGGGSRHKCFVPSVGEARRRGGLGRRRAGGRVPG